MYNKITAYDLETTGFSHTKDSILEVAAVSVDLRSLELSYFSTLVNVKAIPKHISKLTGIDKRALELEGSQDLKSALKPLQVLFHKALIVGHNIKSFDNNFLWSHSDIDLRSYDFVDTLQLMKKRYPQRSFKRPKKRPSFDLNSCLEKLNIKDPCSYLRIKFPTYNHSCTHACMHHRALRDASAALSLYCRIIKFPLF